MSTDLLHAFLCVSLVVTSGQALSDKCRGQIELCQELKLDTMLTLGLRCAVLSNQGYADRCLNNGNPCTKDVEKCAANMTQYDQMLSRLSASCLHRLDTSIRAMFTGLSTSKRQMKEAMTTFRNNPCSFFQKAEMDFLIISDPSLVKSLNISETPCTLNEFQSLDASLCKSGTTGESTTVSAVLTTQTSPQNNTSTSTTPQSFGSCKDAMLSCQGSQFQNLIHIGLGCAVLSNDGYSAKCPNTGHSCKQDIQNCRANMTKQHRDINRLSITCLRRMDSAIGHQLSTGSLENQKQQIMSKLKDDPCGLIQPQEHGMGVDYFLTTDDEAFIQILNISRQPCAASDFNLLKVAFCGSATTKAVTMNKRITFSTVVATVSSRQIQTDKTSSSTHNNNAASSMSCNLLNLVLVSYSVFLYIYTK